MGTDTMPISCCFDRESEKMLRDFRKDGLSGRLATRILRVFIPLQGAMFGRGGFRFFVHPSAMIRGLLEGKGFRLVSKTAAGRIWSVFLFAAPGAD